ncbi:DUF4249 domain-containing protein [Mucilaginibacter sp.]|uniref:DUF4249 domain-containing protein n=1 Tax=Mucilaginibacter sp. TaxID=1882438 RepID=UPI0035BC7914
MNYRIIFLCCIAIIITTYSCRKPYVPPVIVAPNSFLVVEGFINNNDTTFIKLSHTIKLTDTTKLAAEQSASVIVEGSNFTKALSEIKPGTYAIPALNLDASKKYHLRIRTSAGIEYVSDDAEVKITPPIDSISYDVQADGLQLSANAHDAGNKTIYYRWEYEETWRFHARYISNYKVVGANVIRRSDAEDVFNCFGSTKSSTIVLGTTIKLAQDVISKAPITKIDPTSEKIGIRYSMLLKQYALSKDEYQFYDNLKKNTEQLGSVFDALPSQSIGNIHCVTNPGLPIIGYVGISTMQTKRIYIDKSTLPEEWHVKYPYDCEEIPSLILSSTGINEVSAYITSGFAQPTYAITSALGTIIGYGRSSFECADCTLRGVNKKPAFWTD